MNQLETTRKERPILFSAPMVRALLAGTKTQTRRFFKLPRGCSWYEIVGGGERGGFLKDDSGPGWWHVEDARCPYGKTGDRLWVREAWSTHACFDDLPPREIKCSFHYTADGECKTGKGRPSIHMTRWASRITLEIAGVRVERLQDISEADAIAEGCTQNHNGYFWGGPHKVSGQKQMATAVKAYADLWESINGPGSWAANPWVWCVSFQVLKGAK